MRIGILTQPLHKNYGGILQAYALQTVLTNMGHDVWTLNIPFRRTSYAKIRGLASRYYHELMNNDEIRMNRSNLTRKEQIIIEKHTRDFINKNINLTEVIPLIEKIHRVKKYN